MSAIEKLRILIDSAEARCNGHRAVATWLLRQRGVHRVSLRVRRSDGALALVFGVDGQLYLAVGRDVASLYRDAHRVYRVAYSELIGRLMDERGHNTTIAVSAVEERVA